MAWEDAIEFILVGASPVEIGTANYIDPAAGIRIAHGIREHCTRNDVKHVSDLVGLLKVDKKNSVLHSWL